MSDVSAERVRRVGVEIVDASLRAKTQTRAAFAVRGIAAELDVETLRRVLAFLVVDAVWHLPPRSRGLIRAWVLRWQHDQRDPKVRADDV